MKPTRASQPAENLAKVRATRCPDKLFANLVGPESMDLSAHIVKHKLI